MAASVILVGIDVYFYGQGTDNTFSAVFSKAFEKYPVSFCVLIYWLGVLTGHLLPSR